MILNEANVRDLFQGFNTSFNKGFADVETYWQDIAMKVPSTGESETYAWLGDLPGIREWLGDRVIHELGESGYRIKNRLFEETIAVRRTKIEDDQYGIYGPMMEKIGYDTARHPDTLIFDLLPQGFTTLCYDGQNFFDTDHPVGKGAAERSVSNVQAGASEPWYLFDGRQPIKGLIYQERIPFKPAVVMDDERDDIVFTKDLYLYGVRGRSSAGFGLWQMAFASRAALNVANYEAARRSMMAITNDAGRPLGIRPTHMVVPPALEAAARGLLEADTLANGESNIWRGSVKLIVNPYLGLPALA